MGAGLSAGLAVLLSVIVVPLFLGGAPSPISAETPAAAAEPESAVAYKRDIQPILQKYCVDCHSGAEAEAGIGFDRYTDQAAVLKDRKAWKHVLDAVSGGIMPPGDADQPTEEERTLLTSWIDSTLFAVDCTDGGDPGRVTIRRLNRVEYNNTVRDLLGVELRPADDFPSDDVGYGFDNIGDVLSLPPLLMEKYLDAAEQVAEAAVVIPEPDRRRFRGRELTGKGAASSRNRGVHTLASSGDVSAEFEFPRDGEYILRLEAGADQAGDELAKAEFRLDDKVLGVVDVPARADTPEFYELRLPVTRGKKRVSVAFINDLYDPDAADRNRRDRNLHVHGIEIVGPLEIDESKLPEAHRRLVTCRPDGERNAKDCAREIFRKFATRAFRRPATSEEVERLVTLVEMGMEHGGSFEFGVRVAIQGVLVSPHFLFRIEQHPDPDNPGQVQKLSNYELASRLSYFLWSSMPDDELFALAEQGVLEREEHLDHQVRRMLKDPKSSALVQNFATQWLQLRNLDEVTPDTQVFSTFDDALKKDMQRESELFFDSVMREDRSILEFLDGKYTFVNERLAKHYGIPDITGDEFRKVSLAGSQRAGLLTHASILTLTSNPTRTSPVKRGKWIMETILGAAPPPPPPNVPELEETAKASPEATLREQLELHRADPSCASCHRVMDTLGFGFENFDAIGRWRDQDGQHAIDASGTLPGGEAFGGPSELVGVLKGKRREFSRCLTEKMLTYALGRGIEYYDRCTVDRILDGLERNQDKFSVLVAEVVKSAPFRKGRGEGERQ